VDTECCPPRLSKRAKNYERYLALARAEAQIGNSVGAENYYQHAEHYFRSMSSLRGPLVVSVIRFEASDT
jgi:hypothetical protein